MIKRPLFFLIVGLLCIVFSGCTLEDKSAITIMPTGTDNSEGTVAVISNNEEFTPFKSWSHGSHSDADGNTVAADAMQLMARGIESELKSIKYSKDFEIRIDGEPMHVNYMIYTDDFGTYEDSSSLRDKLVIPEEKGNYIICMEVSWGSSSNNYDAYDYVFKLLVE